MARRGRAAVVVLGDIGRSPRMQYHALSLARQANLEVDIVANGGNDPPRTVKENPNIHFYIMKSIHLQGLEKISKVLVLLLKAIMQFFILLWYLCVKIPRPDIFIVQNPPSVPTLAAVKLASWLRNSPFLIDWHNFGYTLLGFPHWSKSHVVVKVYHWFEKFFGAMANGSMCVTEAMRVELVDKWGIKAEVLYDKPPEFFRPALLKEKHQLFCRLENNLHPHGIHDCISSGGGGAPENTLITQQIDDVVYMKPNRPAVVVSSTSWTPDEDFSILLKAAVMYDERVAAALKEDDSVDDEGLWSDINSGKEYLYPRLLFIITGKGPERQKYEKQIKNLKLRRVAFRTMWLTAEDYVYLLGSADLGVCLHTSSSGFDLPMKVVDMFGCGLPVCAVSFKCIAELVKDKHNGLVLSSSDPSSELAEYLTMLFRGFPKPCDTLNSLNLNSLRNGALSTRSSGGWSSNWEAHALPLINQFLPRS